MLDVSNFFTKLSHRPTPSAVSLAKANPSFSRAIAWGILPKLRKLSGNSFTATGRGTILNEGAEAPHPLSHQESQFVTDGIARYSLGINLLTRGVDDQ